MDWTVSMFSFIVNTLENFAREDSGETLQEEALLLPGFGV